MSWPEAFVLILLAVTCIVSWLLALCGAAYIVLETEAADAGDYVAILGLLILGVACAAGFIALVSS